MKFLGNSERVRKTRMLFFECQIKFQPFYEEFKRKPPFTILENAKNKTIEIEKEAKDQD